MVGGCGAAGWPDVASNGAVRARRVIDYVGTHNRAGKGATREECVTDDLEQMGPIDYLVVEFPGSRMTGEGLPLLVDLVDRGIIRILDFVFVKKELDGSVRGVAIADLDRDGELDLAVFEGASSGCSTRATSPMPVACSNRVARRASWSTRTCGRRRSPERFGVAVGNWSRADGFLFKLCWPQSMPPRPGPKPSPPRSPRPESPLPQREGNDMPGLLRGVARTAVVAGTATAVSNRVSRRQAGRWADQEQEQAYQQQAYQQQQPAYAAPAPAEPTGDMDSKLAQLKELAS